MSAQRSEFVSALTAWNDTATGYPRDGCLHALFDARAADGAGAVAALTALTFPLPRRDGPATLLPA